MALGFGLGNETTINHEYKKVVTFVVSSIGQYIHFNVLQGRMTCIHSNTSMSIVHEISVVLNFCTGVPAGEVSDVRLNIWGHALIENPARDTSFATDFHDGNGKRL